MFVVRSPAYRTSRAITFDAHSTKQAAILTETELVLDKRFENRSDSGVAAVVCVQGTSAMTLSKIVEKVVAARLKECDLDVQVGVPDDT